MEIGKLIKYFREFKGITRQELAKLTFFSDKAIGHYETGTRVPDISKLNDIANALNIETNQLIEYEEEMFEEVKPIQNNLNVIIIKETQNILAIKKLIKKAKENNQKLIIILNEMSRLLPSIYFQYKDLKEDIYFYQKGYFDETGLLDEERIKKIKNNFGIDVLESGDKVICIYNYNGRYTVTPSVIYEVISTGFHEEYEFETIEVITDGGMYGTYPKDWFEIYEKKHLD